MNNRILLLLGIMIVTTVSAWITAFRMRRRIKKALGSNATETELTSLATWMRVDEEEQLRRLQGPIIPK
jgi:hypothetical protein